MASNFRKFIKAFSETAYPLNALCKKEAKFEWSKNCNEAFESLKKSLTTPSVLAFPDFGKTFYISVDASNYAVGGYISNDPPPHDHPIEYYSKTLNSAQKNYSTTEKELLAIIMAIEQFRHFIWGKHFVVHTDHQALTYLFNANKTNSRLLRWKLTLAEYSFDIIHRKGSNNTVSDCLSRIEPTESVNIHNLITNPTNKAIMQAITRSRAKETEIIDNATPKSPTFHMNEDPGVSMDTQKYDSILFVIDGRENLPFKKLQLKLKRKKDIKTLNPYELFAASEKIDIIFVPKIGFNVEHISETLNAVRHTCENTGVERMAINSGVSNFHAYRNLKLSLRETFRGSHISINLFTGQQIEITDINDIQEILKVYHRSILGGHRGFGGMKNTIRKYYAWPTMNADIMKYVQECEVCEKTKIHKHTHTPLQITSVSTTPFEKIYVDFVGEISPNSAEGHKHIFTISCDLTKYVVMKPTFDCTALTAARVIVEEVCLIYNFPKTIVSDNGPAFECTI